MNPNLPTPVFGESGLSSADEQEMGVGFLNGKLRATTSKYKARGRTSSAPVIEFEKHLNRVSTAIFNRDLEIAAQKAGVTIPSEPEDKRALAKELDIKRENTYNVLRGIYRFDERYKPSFDEATKFGNAVAKVIGFEGTVTTPIIQAWHQSLTEDFLAHEDASKYITMSQITDEEILDELLDSEETEGVEIPVETV